MSSATTTMDYPASRPVHLARTRVLSAAGAVVAAMAVWTVAVPIFGVHLLVRFGTAAPQSVGLGLVVGASALGSLAGLGLLAVLERRASGARTIWTRVAMVAAPVSLILPLWAGTTVSAKVALALMHVAVAAVLIPSLCRS